MGSSFICPKKPAAQGGTTANKLKGLSLMMLLPKLYGRRDLKVVELNADKQVSTLAGAYNTTMHVELRADKQVSTLAGAFNTAMHVAEPCFCREGRCQANERDGNGNRAIEAFVGEEIEAIGRSKRAMCCQRFRSDSWRMPYRWEQVEDDVCVNRQVEQINRVIALVEEPDCRRTLENFVRLFTERMSRVDLHGTEYGTDSNFLQAAENALYSFLVEHDVIKENTLGSKMFKVRQNVKILWSGVNQEERVKWKIALGAGELSRGDDCGLAEVLEHKDVAQLRTCWNSKSGISNSIFKVGSAIFGHLDPDKEVVLLIRKPLAELKTTALWNYELPGFAKHPPRGQIKVIVIDRTGEMSDNTCEELMDAMVDGIKKTMNKSDAITGPGLVEDNWKRRTERFFCLHYRAGNWVGIPPLPTPELLQYPPFNMVSYSPFATPSTSRHDVSLSDLEAPSEATPPTTIYVGWPGSSINGVYILEDHPYEGMISPFWRKAFDGSSTVTATLQGTAVWLMRRSSDGNWFFVGAKTGLAFSPRKSYTDLAKSQGAPALPTKEAGLWTWIKDGTDMSTSFSNKDCAQSSNKGCHPIIEVGTFILLKKTPVYEGKQRTDKTTKKIVNECGKKVGMLEAGFRFAVRRTMRSGWNDYAWINWPYQGWVNFDQTRVKPLL